MRIGFIVARLNEEKGVIRRLSLALAKEMRRQGEIVELIPFTKTSMLNPPLGKLKNFDCVLIANVGLQSAYYSLLKKLKFIRKPFIAISFGSDIREHTNKIVNLFNKISVSAIDLLIVINPDLVEIAKKRGYSNILYVHNWSEAFA